MCPKGAWVTEDLAVEVLGLDSKAKLRTVFNEGLLPHVFVEHGGRVKAPAPFNTHAFFFVQPENSAPKNTPSVPLLEWIKICQGAPTDSAVADAIRNYSTLPPSEDSFLKLKSSGAIVTSLSPGEAGSGDYRYGTSGGSKPSKASAGDVVTQPDGSQVRRVKRASSAAAGPNNTLDGFLGGKQDNKPRIGGSRSVSGDGEIYVRADGKKVRRVKKSSGSVASEDPSRKSLDGFLGNGTNGKPRIGGSASVAGDQLAINKESSLTGEVYVRADGKKVRRVKKSTASAAPDDNVEIIVRPDGTKVRRIRKTRPADAPSTTAAETPSNSGLSGFLDASSSESKPSLSGSRSVSTPGEEIYVRPDGKKVRRIRKPGTSGSQSVAGDAASVSGASADTEVEIYTRPDGTRVRRIKKKAAPKPAVESAPSPAPAPTPAAAPGSGGAEGKKSLDGFLGAAGGATRPKIGGSASVAGDRIAVSKAESLTGEVYVRADGKKVRRVKKSVAEPGDNVEIITRPDGTKVRRIRKTKPKEENGPGEGLSNFLDSQPRSAPKGGAATVGGDRISKPEPESNAAPKEPIDEAAAREAKAKKNLDKFLSNMDSTPSKVGGSASVAGDMLAVNKESSLTGEVYVRSDGKKVRRVKKVSAAQPGDEVEIITRPDGTKVRRIKRAKKPPEGDEAGKSLDGFLGSAQPVKKSGGAASVSGDMLHSQDSQGEIYIRADGKKVRRIRKSGGSVASGGSNEQYEIYVRPDGKKVRRIRRTAPSSDSAGAAAAPAPVPLPTPMESDEKPSAKETTPVSEQAPAPPESAPQPAPAPAPDPAPAVKVSSLSQSEEEIASQYRKMLKMGMPDGAVMQKMTVDGVAQNIQDSVLAHETPAPPASAVQTPTPPAPAPPAEPAAKVSSLSPEEEDVASHYRKMLKMGMPDGAVMQKMAVDGVAQNIQDSVLAHEVPAPLGSAPAASPAAAKPSLSAEDEEIASQYRKMLKMGMPEGAVGQKMAVDGVSQHIQDSVLAGEPPAPPAVTSNGQNTSGDMKLVAKEDASIPEGMALVPKDHATVPDGMVLVPKEQAQRTIPEGMVAVPKEQAGGDTVPEGYVLVPKDQVRGDPGKDDLILVKKEQVKDEGQIVLIGKSDESGLKKNDELNENERAEIEGANIVSFEDLSSQVEALKQGSDGKKPRFLLQALPSDRNLEQDFIRKNLLPKEATSPPARPPAPPPAPAPAPAASSSSIADLLAQMSKMGGDFDAEKMGELLQMLDTAEKRRKKLEKQLAQAGVAIAEDIDYEICIKKVAEIGKRMGEIGGSDVTHPDKEEQNRLREEYFKLEQEMEKYNSALMLTDEYQAEQDRMEQKWEEDNAPGNLEALKKLRRHMPVEVRNMSEAQLTTEPTPNGKYLPMAMTKKFKRTNVLQLIRRDPDDIVRMHPSTLDNMRVTGLTLTERRALYEHLRTVGPQWKAMKAEKMTERKWTWYNMMKGNFKENLASWQRHVDQYGPPGAHPYATRANPNEGCPLIGKQCPLKADKLIDYDGDYGFPEDAVYEVSDVKKADTDDPGAKAMQEALELMKEKKANERSDALKKHYNGKLLQVSKANGSCEQMDEMMEKLEFGMMKWIEDIILLGDDKSKLTDDVKKKEVANYTDALNDCKLSTLDFCGRSGMQLSGKKGGDSKPDPRSIVECSLAQEVADSFDVFTKFVTNRLKQLEFVDTRIKSTIDMLNGLFSELRERNVKRIEELEGERLPLSRKLKTQDEMEKEIKDKIEKAKAAAAGAESEEAGGGGGPPLPGPPRGGLMDAIKGGRGGGGGRGGLLDAIKGGRGGGRGGLLDAIKGGRGGGGGGRGGLLDAIKGRGSGGGGGGGGRGGLLDAIKGRGGAGGGGGGGRGGLLDAIKGRGGRGGGGGGDGGGRGGLLAAIQARGGGGD